MGNLSQMSGGGDHLMARIVEAAASSSLRSQLARWMQANHEAFARVLREERPRWVDLVKVWAEEGKMAVPDEFWSEDPVVRDRARTRAVRTAQRTWERVEKRARARPHVQILLAPTDPSSPEASEGTAPPLTDVERRIQECRGKLDQRAVPIPKKV